VARSTAKEEEKETERVVFQELAANSAAAARNRLGNEKRERE
jgi:hypothetical protein